MPKKTALLILLLGVLFRPLRAEEKPLSLQEAVSVALQHNLEVVRAQYALEEAKGRRLQSEARPEPSVAMSTEGVPFNLKTSDTTEVNLSLEQPIEFPGKQPLRAKVGRYGEDIARLELEHARLMVTAQVKRAYWKAVLLENTVTSLEALADLLDEMIDSSLIRYQAGTVAYGDVLRVRVEKARLQNETIGARREKEAAKAELVLLLGRATGDPLILTDGLEFVPFDRSLEDVKAAARASRPSLQIAVLRAEQAGAASALAAKNRLPDFSLGLFFPSIRFNAWGIAFGLNLPISKSRTEGERLEAAARHASSLAGAEARARRLDALVETAYVSVRAAADQVLLFEHELLVEMEEELRSGLAQYQYGKIESYSLLDLHRTYAAAKLERLKALFLYLSGLADLEAAGEES
jgi:cobalt-zinc-cadmium efflux system outer membrane protein